VAQNFISKFEVKMNQLRFAVVATMLAAQSGSPPAAREFLTKILEKRERLGAEAALYLDMEVVLVKLKQVTENVLSLGHGMLPGLLHPSIATV
jgi:menaquinone-dependent protoporphyrinogen IX oxidase